jgi:hypothetical protein
MSELLKWNTVIGDGGLDWHFVAPPGSKMGTACHVAHAGCPRHQNARKATQSCLQPRPPVSVGTTAGGWPCPPCSRAEPPRIRPLLAFSGVRGKGGFPIVTCSIKRSKKYTLTWSFGMITSNSFTPCSDFHPSDIFLNSDLSSYLSAQHV